ncbi:MAG: chromosome segregation protein SMC, partial [Rhodobiaceae bacterium]
RLAEEEAEIRASISDDEQAAEAEAAAALAEAVTTLNDSETAYDAANRAAAEYAARQQALEATLAQNAQRRDRLMAEQKQAQNTRGDVENAISADFDVAARRSELQDLDKKDAESRQALTDAEAIYRAARETQSAAADPAREARAALERLVGERDALALLFERQEDDAYAALVDDVTVTHGYETALGAALGDDLEASPDVDAPAAWTRLGAEALAQKLPDGVESLAAYVAGSSLLTRALSQVGLVERAQGDALQAALLPGQKLVSQQGDLWRWDGFSHKAEAPTGAAKRLAQRARLEDLQTAIPKAEEAVAVAVTAQDYARDAVDAASHAQDTARINAREAGAALTEAQKLLSEAETSVAAQNEKLKALDGSLRRIEEDLNELNGSDANAQEALENLGGQDALLQAVETARGEVDAARLTHGEKRGALDGLKSRREARDAQMQRLSEDEKQWSQRKVAAGSHIDALSERQSATEKELTGYQDVPANLAERRAKLADMVVEAEESRKQAADALAIAESRLSEADSQARETQAAVNQARETQVRLEATLDGNQQRLDETAQRVREALQIEPEQALAISGHDPEKPFPEAEAMESKLEKLRRERENLGGVNLRAAEEADEIQQQIDTMTAEHEELTSAINKLRHGIGQLNREGRQRLLAAFETVNGHFKRLFTQLFGGGSAELTLTESDDPLQAGLEILAHPPGKKPQVMSLLSGGEQALTATALIFAVFLTNPSPICVLDEVDAPLDDANVERFCNLVKEIADETGTRFLVITHHALSMARMDRLFGVTMQERGVSQLLSVDLSTAEQFAESGRDKMAEKDNLETKSIG